MDKLNFSPFPVLKTDRLLLRQIEMSDDKLMLEYRSNRENFEFVDMPVYTSIEEAQEHISKMNKGVEDSKWIIWAVADINTKEILGTISIWNISVEESKGELGYGLFPCNVGKGIMSEAVNKVVEYGFNNMGLETIEAYTNILNKKSIALLERKNFKKVSSIIENNTSNGVPMEMVIYEKRKNY